MTHGTCSVCSKQERERYNTFKRTFRRANWYIAKKRGDRYYNTVRAAYKAQITGSTLERFLKGNGERACRDDVVRYVEGSGSRDAGVLALSG